MTVGHLLTVMSSAEITEWMAYYRLQAEDEAAANEPQQKPK